MAGRNNYKKGEGPKPEVYHADCPGELKVEGESYPPVRFTPEICKEICERIVMGQTLLQLSRIVGFPDRKTIYDWRRKHKEFYEDMEKAYEMSDQAVFDEGFEIAHNAKYDYAKRLAYNGPDPGWEVNGIAIQRARLMWDARTFWLGKRSRRFKEKVEVEHSGSIDIADRLAAGRARVAAAKRGNASN